LKIAMLVYEFPPKIVGGLGTYAAEITRKYVLLGHDVSVFTMNDDEGNLPTREIWKGIEIHRPIHIDISDSLPVIIAEDIKKWGRGISFFSKIWVYNCLAAAKLVNELVKVEEYEYDIAVVHDWLSMIGGSAVKKELGIPLVFHVHSTEAGRSLGNGSEVVSGIEKAGGNDADLVITVSYAMRDELIGLGFPPEKVKVSYNGVDPQKYSLDSVPQERIMEIRRSYCVEDDGLLLLFVGRLVWIKGVQNLIMAMPYILESFPKAKLAIVGLGEMSGYLERLVHDLRLEDVVKFRFSFIPEEERIAQYASCDVAVFPSMYEPFGIVALEAMSMKKPVVVGAAGTSGMREIVIPRGPDQCGIHINPKDPKDIAWGILSALSTPEKRAMMGENGRKRVLQEFTWDLIAKRTADLYEQLIESKKKR